MIRILPSTAMPRLLARRTARLAEAEGVVRPILEAVRVHGDRALLEYARQFDALDRKTVAVPAPDFRRSSAMRSRPPPPTFARSPGCRFRSKRCVK
jgi:histidinol dehydrogenase